jgi:hypothetical protein
MLASNQYSKDNKNPGQEQETRKPYQKPEIIHEQELEIRTGSPISPNPLDPFSDS